jgi:hypothetical protein
MKNYVLTIFETADVQKGWASLTPEQMQEGLAKYMAFSQRLVDEGRMLGGEGLSQKGNIIKADTLEVTDGPYVLAKEMVGGFYYFKAESLEEATEIAKACPALYHGCNVEVREQMEY